MGMNLGSVVMIVVPVPLWGSSSIVRFRSFSSAISGRIMVSIKRLINVDLPLLTGPTTPR